MSNFIGGDPPNHHVSGAAALDAAEDITLGNISTEAQVNFGPERKSRGLPSRPHLPRFDQNLWGVNDDTPAQVQTAVTAPQSSSNIPKTIQEIDKLLNKGGADLFPLTTEAKISEWKNSASEATNSKIVPSSSGRNASNMNLEAQDDDEPPQLNNKGYKIKIHQETPWSAKLEYVDQTVPKRYTWAHPSDGNEESVLGDFSDKSITAPLPTDSASQLSRKSTAAEGDSTAEGRRWKSLMEKLDESREVITAHEQDQDILSGLAIPSGFGTNTLFNLKVEPRILEFQPVGINDSNMHWCHFSHEETASSMYMRARLISLDTASNKVSALWNLPSIVNDRTGAPQPISIGDIGFMDSLGGFRTLFNVFQSQEENRRNGTIAPETHQQCAEFSHHMARQALPQELQRPTIYVQNAKRKTGSPPSHFSFTCDQSKDFAILVLPEGGQSREFNKSRFARESVKEYFRNNVFSWYKFAEENGYQGTKNGSLFLIAATVHAPVWGMAVSLPSDSTDNKKKPKETPIYHQSGDNEHHYIWDSPYSSLLHRAGPTYDELSKANPTLTNRCLAVSPFSIWLDNTTWNTHFGGNTDNTASLGPSHLNDIVPPSSSSSSKMSIQSIKSMLSRASSKKLATKSPVINDYMTLEEI